MNNPTALPFLANRRGPRPRTAALLALAATAAGLALHHGSLAPWPLAPLFALQVAGGACAGSAVAGALATNKWWLWPPIAAAAAALATGSFVFGTLLQAASL